MHLGYPLQRQDSALPSASRWFRLLPSSLLQVLQLQERTQFVSALECRSAFVDLGWEPLEQTDGNIAILERQCFAEVSASGVHTSGIGTKVAERRISEMLENESAREDLL